MPHCYVDKADIYSHVPFYLLVTRSVCVPIITYCYCTDKNWSCVWMNTTFFAFFRMKFVFESMNSLYENKNTPRENSYCHRTTKTGHASG